MLILLPNLLISASPFLALALITVFDKKNGLTVFLTKEIDRPVIDKDLQLSFHTAFHLIQFFITEYSDVLLPHVILIKVGILGFHFLNQFLG